MILKLPSRRTLLLLTGFALSPALLFCFAPPSIQIDSVLAQNIVSSAFSDVSSTHLNSEAIDYVKSQHIVDGYPDGTFRPDDPINRAEFIKIVIEAHYKGQADGNNCFPDVGSEWFAKYVCFGKTHNIISGYPDGSFEPANTISFVEIAKILVNINGFAVTADPDIWYRPYVEKLAEFNAIPSSITNFNEKVNRGEVAEIIYRLMAHVMDKPSKTYEELVDENAVSLPDQEQIGPGLPVRLKIPGIHVDSALESVGLTAEGGGRRTE